MHKNYPLWGFFLSLTVLTGFYFLIGSYEADDVIFIKIDEKRKHYLLNMIDDDIYNRDINASRTNHSILSYLRTFTFDHKINIMFDIFVYLIILFIVFDIFIKKIRLLIIMTIQIGKCKCTKS